MNDPVIAGVRAARLASAAVAAAALFFAASAAHGRPVSPDAPWGAEEAPGILVPLVEDPQPSTHRVPAPPELELRQKGLAAAQATINVNFLAAGVVNVFGTTCQAWPAEAQTAFGYAAAVWASQLQSPVAITVNACWANLGSGSLLGSAGPRTFVRNFSGAPQAGVWYPIALANALGGTDLNGATAEVEAQFNSNRSNWYFGTDANPAVGTLDFVSVVLHEIGHGLGFTGTMEFDAGSANGSWGFTCCAPLNPGIYDRFTENGAGQSLINTSIFPNPGTALGAALRSNSVFFNGTNANAANASSRVPLYAPSTWSDGSSFSHLAESFNGTANALMTFSLSSGEAAHSPGPVTLGMFRDMGWELQASSTADLTLAHTVSTNPASTGRDAVFTMTAVNLGPGTATGVALTATYDGSATVVWASPGCTKQAGVFAYVCTAGTLNNGASSTAFRLVLRRDTTGSLFNNVVVAASTTDPTSGNNSAPITVTVNQSPSAQQVQRYRLYSPVTLEHHFTTDLNEYTVLGTLVGTWVQEGTVGKVLNNPGSFGGVQAVPYYRLYDNNTRWHHWTTDANEYYTLSVLFPWWNGEGVDGWILPTSAPGSVQLYRLLYPFVAGLHHWTIDTNEYNTLISTYGWIGEGGSGFVIP